jgi:hypothetical protein
MKRRAMNISILYLIGLFFLAGLMTACNSGETSNRGSVTPVPTPPAADISTLDAYINLLQYNTANDAVVANQQSMNISNPVRLSSVQAVYYSDAICANKAQSITIQDGSESGVLLNPGTYTTNSQSNYALCSEFSIPNYTGCAGLFQAVNANKIKAMRFIYYYQGESTADALFSQCMYNKQFGYEATLNYSGTPSTACSGGDSTCNFSQSYNYSLKSSEYPHTIFITNSVYDGDLGGLSGADAKCNSDASKPSSPTGVQYKALLRDNAATVDGINYYRIDNSTIIAQATGAELVGYADLINTISPYPDVEVNVWTGAEPLQNCDNWTNADSVGFFGYGDASTGLWYAGYLKFCQTTMHLYCAAQ